MKGSIGSHFRQQRGERAAGKKQPAAAAPAPAPALAAAALRQDEEAAEAQLRQFDLATKYGPCMGITRMQRWERAAKLGLEPPQEVRELILRFGDLDGQHNVNVFHHPY